MLFLKSFHQKQIQRIRPWVKRIVALDHEWRALSDEALQSKTEIFRKRYADGACLDDLLVEAFATMREASRRVLGLHHFEEQLIGGIVLHHGKIAEMKMGEGKTLVATLPAYLNALSGKKVHIVTVNDYLAQRDSEWMGPVYQFLGLSVGLIVSHLDPESRKKAYKADVTYATNHELGFDFLRDHMAMQAEDQVQYDDEGRSVHQYSIVDEVDSVLIDEARTPLIISGADTRQDDLLWMRMSEWVLNLKKDIHFQLDFKSKQAHLTDEGHAELEKILVQNHAISPHVSLYDPEHVMMLHHAHMCLRAHHLFFRDIDYMLSADPIEVCIIDEHTGRSMPGRRWSDGLHQAIEAKEHVPIRAENQTLASTTYQNYFRLYQKIAGMTGTADTESQEFHQIYGLDVVVIPTHRPVIRIDHPDQVYVTQREKFNAVIEDIEQNRSMNRPVLVGTASIEASEHISDLLKAKDIPHAVLNAKYHEQEAQIIAKAGMPGAVTIATHMAGRGTDIVLGGHDPAHPEWQMRHDQVVAAGGLHIIGSERHESRRIDHQLRGRSGRQGDPGSSRFYLSLEDPLLKIFAGPWVSQMMRKLGMQEGERIEHRMITRSIANAQKRVEAYYFDARKQLLEFDNVANEQRQVIYCERQKILRTHSIDAMAQDFCFQAMREYIDHFQAQKPDCFWEELLSDMATHFDLSLNLDQMPHAKEIYIQHFQDAILEKFKKQAELLDESWHSIQRWTLLSVLDEYWKEHLMAMDYLKQGIHLRGYAQMNPKQEYQREAFQLFGHMMMAMRYEVLKRLLSPISLSSEHDDDFMKSESNDEQTTYRVFEALMRDPSAFSPDESKHHHFTKRNAPCFCGSGKKYKHCCGSLG